MTQTFASKSASIPARQSPTTSFGRLLLAKRTGREFVPSPISFRNSERHNAEARRGGQPAPFMPVCAFADFVGLPLYLVESYINQGLLSALGEPDSRYVEVRLAKRQLSAIGRRIKWGKFRTAA